MSPLDFLLRLKTLFITIYLIWLEKFTFILNIFFYMHQNRTTEHVLTTFVVKAEGTLIPIPS